MALPYPKQGGRTVGPARPSSGTGGRGPVFPANDRYYGGAGRPSYRPANKNIVDPSYFNPPKAGANPFQAPTRAVVRPDRNLGKSALAGMGRMATRATPYLALGEFAFSTLTSIWNRQYAGDGHGFQYPQSGYWEKRYGDFGPYVNYNVVPNWRAHNTWHAPLTGQAMTATVTYGMWDTAANAYGMWFRNFGTVVRYAHHSSYFRVATRLAATNGVWGHPSPLPPPYVWADPFSAPVGSASGGARPTPYPMVPYQGHNPYRSPVEQTHRGNAAPKPAYPVDPFQWPPMPGFVWTTSPGLPPRGGVVESPGKPKPPGPKVRERKFMGMGGGKNAALFAVIGAVTEGMDLLGAFWKALPKEGKTGYYELHYVDKVTGEVKTYMKYRHKATMQEKINDVLRNWDKIDVQKALSNAVDEAIEDRVYAGIGKAYQKARANQYRNNNADFNAERDRYGRRYRSYVGRRKGDQYSDYGPHGRGYQTGSGYRPEDNPNWVDPYLDGNPG